MNRHVNAIAGRLSLRHPQRRSLEILDRVVEIAPSAKGADVEAALAVIRSEFPSVADFERDFPSLCFALATGVGKTRLMGAFVAYLHLAHGVRNFFVLAPNLTIYDKLIADFTPNTPKYVFKGIAEFATVAPEIVTGDNYENVHPDRLFDGVRVNIFNISKINSEARGGNLPRIKRLSEYIGESYFDYLAALPDLVLIMDESHRYRASAGVRAINELKPILGLELTATPFVESARGPVPFKNVVYDYPLARAMADGFVKEPAVVTRKNFDPTGMSPEQVERMKLEDGVRLHEATKVELTTYARESGRPVVKPFLLAIARDTTHAGELVNLVESDGFFDGRYKGKVIQVDSSKTGVEEEKMVARLLKVEHGDEPTEIVVHVNMLKEGWDVTNLYTIVPLRAANARTLIEQSIGRGLRLPYGARTGVAAVDRLSIVAHDRFQEIVDEANRPDSPIRLQAIVLDPDDFGRKTESVVVAPSLSAKLGLGDTAASGVLPLAAPPRPWGMTVTHAVDGVERDEPPVFVDPHEREIATITCEVIRGYESRPDAVPTVEHLKRPEIREAIVRAVEERRRPAQGELEGVVEKPDVAAVVSKTVDLVAKQTIDIPRIHVVPKGEVRSGFKPFALDLSTMRYAAVSDDLWLQYLRTGGSEVVATGPEGKIDGRPEDAVVAGLMEFDDVSYDDEADLLFGLAGQVVDHLRSYLADPEVGKVLRCHSGAVARFVHAQMQAHRWEVSDAGYEVKVSKGFSALKECAYSREVGDPVRDFRKPVDDKSRMTRYLFGEFKRCLYPVQKFGSDPERIMAVILDRDSSRWCRPVKGQFQLFYRDGADHAEYVPDFVAEDVESIYMVEVKAADEMTDPTVLAKKDAALLWCGRATEFAEKHGGKPWRYLLVPHDVIAENMTLGGLAATRTQN